jgi:hypothetical protein
MEKHGIGKEATLAILAVWGMDFSTCLLFGWPVYAPKGFLLQILFFFLFKCHLFPNNLILSIHSDILANNFQTNFTPLSLYTFTIVLSKQANLTYFSFSVVRIEKRM